jgi:hypothetical protein
MTTPYTDDDWLTPPFILRSLGPFDLDPCSPAVRPWETARNYFTIADDGLAQAWHGRVWCNPPYSKIGGQSQLELWLARMVAHGNGMALTNANTQTKWFFDFVWNGAEAVLFLRGKLNFYRPDGRRGQQGHSPSVIAAYSERDAAILYDSGLDGKFIPLVVRFTHQVRTTWRQLVRYLLQECNGVASLEQLYALAAGHPKTAHNPHWKAKVRQQVQAEARRIGPATWQQTLSLA